MKAAKKFTKLNESRSVEDTQIQNYLLNRNKFEERKSKVVFTNDYSFLDYKKEEKDEELYEIERFMNKEFLRYEIMMENLKIIEEAKCLPRKKMAVELLV